jgi:hypothetical protein
VCFSAEADFVAGAAISGVGVATLTHVDRPRRLALGALPLVFGIHQITEGFVWLGLDGSISPVATDRAAHLYAAIAWIVVPVLAPVAVWLITPRGPRRDAMAGCVVLGALVAVYLGATVVRGDVVAYVAGHTVRYGGAPRYAGVATVFYVIATCAPPLLSRQRAIAWFGVANLVAVAIIATVQIESLTSVWCVWAAIFSVLVYAQFIAWRRSDTPPPDSIRRRRTPSEAAR